MITQSPTPADDPCRSRRRVRPPCPQHRRTRCPLFAIFTASAQAHTATATATCNSVTIHWTAFAASGGRPGARTRRTGRSCSPRRGGGAAPTHPTARRPSRGTSFSHTEPIPTGNGTVVVVVWASNETRDGHNGSFSKHLTIANCPVVVAARPPPPPVPPAARAGGAQPTLSTTASPGWLSVGRSTTRPR